ncbi:chitin synthase III catalytic subunit [Vararia minispora EC-137]|uniref:Chitin synthase III catalytic subunit n=1 Tax=Vararia minispora EC-137 TaxID=1314806 RepID=A0ACB8Q8H2_9AGAM|nr:chitin synthase III catalytic subunit [Vararia minispora EC-137]
MTSFGDFKPLCSHTPSYPWCNLFYHQARPPSPLEFHNPSTLVGVSANFSSAPVGINPECGTLRVGSNGSLGNIANTIVCGLSFFITLGLIWLTNRRKAAVGRFELQIFLVMYLITLPLQILTTGSFLEQGSNALAILTAIHAGSVAALFWALLGNAIVATQVVEDGTISSLVPFMFFALAFFVATTYISLDVAFTFTRTFGPSSPPEALTSVPVFVLTSIWPGAAALIYFITMSYIVIGQLREFRPMAYYALAAILFILSQLDYFLLNQVICNGTNAGVDGSFVATILETACVFVLYRAWKSITEESWDDNIYYR